MAAGKFFTYKQASTCGIFLKVLRNLFMITVKSVNWTARTNFCTQLLFARLTKNIALQSF
jgi:hypothetical protein